MADEYTTISGDTFDSIAYEKYADCEMADRIMKANIDKIDYMVFPAGITLEIPSKDDIADEISVASDCPEWRQS